MVVDSFLRCCTSPILGDRAPPLQGGGAELLSPVSRVFRRPATGFEDLGQRPLVQSPRSHGQNQVNEFLLVESWLPLVDQQECDGSVCADSFVAVEERVVLAEMKEVRCRHGRNGGVQEFTAECCLGRGCGRLESAAVAESRSPAVALNLLLVDLQNFVQRQEYRLHEVRPGNSLG